MVEELEAANRKVASLEKSMSAMDVKNKEQKISEYCIALNLKLVQHHLC